jgi:hypothetical protein
MTSPTTNSNAALAIVITPDDDGELFERVERIREQHQKGYGRWPPHINLLWPFVHERDLVKQQDALEQAISELDAFEIRLTHIDVMSDALETPNIRKDKKAAKKAVAASNLYTYLNPEPNVCID